MMNANFSVPADKAAQSYIEGMPVRNEVLLDMPVASVTFTLAVESRRQIKMAKLQAAMIINPSPAIFQQACEDCGTSSGSLGVPDPLNSDRFCALC